jgi:hypothetical protein
MADRPFSEKMWRAVGYFITAVTIGGWVAVLAYWMHIHGWIHLPGWIHIPGLAL